MQRLDLLVVLLHGRQLRHRVLHLLLQSGFLLGDGGFPALPVLLQRLDLGQQRRALVAEPLELRLGLVEVGGLFARLVQLSLEQLAIRLELGVRRLAPLLQPGHVGDQPLALGLPFLACRLERLDLCLHGFELLLQLGAQVGQPGFVLGELGPGLLPFLFQLRLLADGGIAVLEQGLAVHRPLELSGLQRVEVLLGELEVGPDLLLVVLEFLRRLHPLLFELAELAAPLLVAALGSSDVILQPAELDLGSVVTLLQVLVPLLEGLMLVEQRLAIHGPLQLRVLEFVQLLLLFGQLALGQGKFFLLLFELAADVFLQRLEMGDELLVLLQDVGERLRLGRFGSHQAAFRPCWR